MKRYLAAIAALAMLAGSTPVQAQDAAPWRLSYFPYFTVSPNDGMMGIARMIWARQAGWGERIVNSRSVSVDAGYSTKDSWLGRVTYKNPTLADGWRLMARANIGHEANFGHPESELEHDRIGAWIDVTRRITGPISLAVRGGVRTDRVDLKGDDGFPLIDETDASVRGALVVDLRDREYEVNNGVLLEAGLIGGAGGGDGYSAAYAQAKGYWHPVLPLRLSARGGWRQAIDGDVFAPMVDFPAWEDNYSILGGHRTHRGFGTGQLNNRGAAFAGLEAHLDIINVGELGAVTILAFVDGAKSITNPDPESMAPFIDDEWRVGAGGGLALRFMRQATLTITAAQGDNETRWYVGSGFSW
jgi:outer membrane protein assembly factor BamA